MIFIKYIKLLLIFLLITTTLFTGCNNQKNENNNNESSRLAVSEIEFKTDLPIFVESPQDNISSEDKNIVDNKPVSSAEVSSIDESSETPSNTSEINNINTNETSNNNNSSTATPDTSSSITDDDLYCMAAVIYTEAGGDKFSNECRMMVGCVVLNRVNNSRYPDTIRGVLTQSGQYSNYSYKGVHFPKRAQYKSEAHAVERAYECAKIVLNGGFIIPSNVVYQAEFIQGSGIYKKTNGMYFCYQ